MNILCYGVSEARQRERCEFFEGAGCQAETASQPAEALALLAQKHFDAVVFGSSMPLAECELLAEAMRALQPMLQFFPLAQFETGPAARNGDLVGTEQEQWASLVEIYLQLSSRFAGTRAS